MEEAAIAGRLGVAPQAIESLLRIGQAKLARLIATNGTDAGVSGETNKASGTAFVGREHELSSLLAALDDATAGAGRLVLLLGEAGIGKTRTAGEFARV